ncbi:MAG: hypothetical protein ACLQIH_17245 [Myxococcaceae bacterium]
MQRLWKLQGDYVESVIKGESFNAPNALRTSIQHVETALGYVAGAIARTPGEQSSPTSRVHEEPARALPRYGDQLP